MTRYRNIAIIFAVVCLICIMAAIASAATTVTISWDANTESDLAGYKLYQSSVAAGPFAAVQTLGKVTTTQVIVTDGAYWFKLTATDTFLNESGFSNTVTFLADTIAPAAPATLRISSALVTP